MDKYFKLLLICCVLSSCAGRTPNPTSITRPGDENLTCQYVQSELSEIEAKIQKLAPDSNRTGQNVALGVTGAFLLVPLFFMNFSDAEKIEMEALQGRYNHLARLYNDKRCSTRPYPTMATVVN